MQEYDYDFQRVLDAENAVKETTPVAIEPKKPYGKMIAAAVVYGMTVGLLQVIFNTVVLIVTDGNVDMSGDIYQACQAFISVVNVGMYILIPFLFAKSTYKALRPRLAFMGCFFVQEAFSSAFTGVIVNVLAIMARKLTSPDAELSEVAVHGVVSVISEGAAIVFQLVILLLLVKLIHANGLFAEEDTIHEKGIGRYSAKAPVAAAVCAAVTVVFTFGSGKLFELFAGGEPGGRNVLISALSGGVRVAFIFACFAVGKAVCRCRDGSLLFACWVTGASAMRFGGYIISFVFSVVSAAVSSFTDAAIPTSVENAVPYACAVVNAVVAALIGYFVFKRLNRAKEPAEIAQ